MFAFDITPQVVREKPPFCLAIVIDLSLESTNFVFTLIGRYMDGIWIPKTVHLINTGNEQLATGNSIRRRHERRKSRFNFIHGVKIPSRRFCTIGVYVEKSNLAQKHLVAVLR